MPSTTPIGPLGSSSSYCPTLAPAPPPPSISCFRALTGDVTLLLIYIKPAGNAGPVVRSLPVGELKEKVENHPLP